MKTQYNNGVGTKVSVSIIKQSIIEFITTFVTRTKITEIAARNLLNILNRKSAIYLANLIVINNIKTIA